MNQCVGQEDESSQPSYRALISWGSLSTAAIPKLCSEKALKGFRKQFEDQI